jgi:hypothetical protein
MMRDPAARRGILDGLIVSGLLAVAVFLTTVVFPPGPNESDDDPEYMVQWFIAVGLLALLLIIIGARGRRRRPDDITSGLVAGAWAGGVIAVMITVIFLIVNNIWFGVVSQQHDKRIAFANSGFSSMRTFINVTQLQGGVFVLVVLTLIGALLGLTGGVLFGRGRTLVAHE